MNATDETYQGYSNRETWAFNLHWQNDEGLYRMVLEEGVRYTQENPGVGDWQLGERVIEYVKDDLLEEFGDSEPLRMMAKEVGSWWRVNETEVGEAVRESLGVES